MKVSLYRQGGFLDLDQRVEVHDDRISVTDSGVSREVGPVDGASAKRLSDLARLVAELPQDAVADTAAVSDTPVDDEMRTEIEIEDQGTVRRLAVVSGADAPPAVWDLISAVEGCVSG